MSSLTITPPSLNITNIAEQTGANITEIEGINVEITDPNSPFDGMTLKEVLDGGIQITGNDIMKAFENSGMTTIKIPIVGVIDTLLNIT